MTEHDITVHITCDLCKDSVVTTSADPDVHLEDAYSQAYENAQKDGWRISKVKDVCPTCAEIDRPPGPHAPPRHPDHHPRG